MPITNAECALPPKTGGKRKARVTRRRLALRKATRKVGRKANRKFLRKMTRKATHGGRRLALFRRAKGRRMTRRK